MPGFRNKLSRVFNTLSLTALLTLNLFFIVFALLAVLTVLVLLGADGGFFLKDGMVSVGGALVFIYGVCIAAAVSIVIMIRFVFIHPIREIIAALGGLAEGKFDTRVDLGGRKYVPAEIRDFADSFNKTASELAGTQILRKDFISNFSHEFKTPIVSISGFADLLLSEDISPEEQKEFLTIIRDESRRLAELSSSVLMMSRIESQEILTGTAPFRLDEQLRQCVLVTQQKWKEKELAFAPDLPDTVLDGNEGLLKEVWLNILDNAAKFSPQRGTVAITLQTDSAKTAVTVRITDEGPGMDEATAARIFEQFYQGDTSHRSQGNGLGLALVKKIAQLHGGTVAVDTAPGWGSTFIVSLPPGRG